MRILQPIQLMFVLCWMLAALVVAAPSPTQQVHSTIDQVLEVLRNRSLSWHDRQSGISKIVDQRFDFRSMSQSVLATNWRKASPAERERFVEFFSQYLEITYMEKLKKYTDESVRYGQEKIRGDRATVETFIVGNGTEIPVTYKLKLTHSEWYVYDVVIEGTSLVSNYRNVYSTILKSEGMDGLLTNLETQLSPAR